MSITKHHNPEYSGGIPLALGDRYFGQDLYRDYYFLLDRLGHIIGENADQSKFIISGGAITQDTGTDNIDITALVAYLKFTVTVPDSFAALPPTTKSEDVEWLRVNMPTQNNFDISVTATLDGATTNFVKVAYKELDGQTRNRAKKAGSYNYEQSPGFVLTVDSIAPTDKEIQLGTIVSAGSGAVMTIEQNTITKTEQLRISFCERENLVINGDFQRAFRWLQPGLAAFTNTTDFPNNDGQYLFDRFRLLSDGNDVVDVGQRTNVPNGRGKSMIGNVQTINKKFGWSYTMENKDCSHLQDKRVSLSFWARTIDGQVIENLRAGILTWDGTADSPTSNPISIWGASGVNPTLVTNWTFEGTTGDLALTLGWQRFTLENVLIDTPNMTNIAFFIWSDDTTTTLVDEVELAQVEFVEANKAVPTQRRESGEEIALCQRYFQVYNAGISNAFPIVFFAQSTSISNGAMSLSTPLRATPILNWFASNKQVVYFVGGSAPFTGTFSVNTYIPGESAISFTLNELIFNANDANGLLAQTTRNIITLDSEL